MSSTYTDNHAIEQIRSKRDRGICSQAGFTEQCVPALGDFEWWMRVSDRPLQVSFTRVYEAPYLPRDRGPALAR